MSRFNYAYCSPNIQPTGKYDSIMISYAGYRYAVAAETVYDLNKRRIQRFSDNVLYSCTGTDQDVASVCKWVQDYRDHYCNDPRRSFNGLTVGDCARGLKDKLFNNHPIGDREVVISGTDQHNGGCVKVWGPHRYFKSRDFHLGGMHAFEFINERKKFKKPRENFGIWLNDSLAVDYIREYYISLNERNLLLGNLVTTHVVFNDYTYLRIDDLRVAPSELN